MHENVNFVYENCFGYNYKHLFLNVPMFCSAIQSRKIGKLT